MISLFSKMVKICKGAVNEERFNSSEAKKEMDLCARHVEQEQGPWLLLFY